MELYIRTEEFLDQMETDFIETLQKSLGDSDFKTTLKKNISDLKPRGQYIVLVAGEMIQLLFYTLSFLYKNIFYKNIEAKICEILRIS